MKPAELKIRHAHFLTFPSTMKFNELWISKLEISSFCLSLRMRVCFANFVVVFLRCSGLFAAFSVFIVCYCDLSNNEFMYRSIAIERKEAFQGIEEESAKRCQRDHKYPWNSWRHSLRVGCRKMLCFEVRCCSYSRKSWRRCFVSGKSLLLLSTCFLIVLSVPYCF